MRTLLSLTMVLVLLTACDVPATPTPVAGVTPTPTIPAPSDLIINAWQDGDRNGIRGEQEAGVAGVTVQAGPLPLLTTGVTGRAVWSGFLHGCWGVTLGLPAGWSVIYPSNMLCLEAGDMTLYPIALEETR